VLSIRNEIFERFGKSGRKETGHLIKNEFGKIMEQRCFSKISEV